MTPTLTPTPTPAPSPVRRTAVALGLFGGVTLLAALPFGIFWGTLPDPVATHWSPGGQPDGSLSKSGAALLLVAMPAAWAAAGALIVRFGRGPVVHIGALLGGVGALTAVVTWAEVLANVHAPTWHHTGTAVLYSLIPAFAVGGAVTVSVWRLAPGTLPPVPTAPRPGHPAPGEMAAWTGHARAAWGWAPPLAVFGLGVAVVVITGEGVVGVPAIAFGLALSAFDSIRVTVDRTGLDVRYSWLARPVTHIPLEQVINASAIDLRPSEWGGWGYRGSRRAFGRAAVVLRAGPAIRLDLTDNRTFAVTVDDAATGAGWLNDLRDRVGR